VPIIAAGGSFIELAMTELVINSRYALMSVTLSQKLGRSVSLLDKFIISFANTDALLAEAQPLSCGSIALGDMGFFHVKNAGKATVWATSEPIGLWAHTALSDREALWRKQETGRIGGVQEYGIDTEGRLWVAVPGDVPLTAEAVQQWLKDADARLWLLDLPEDAQ
jgi:hypothetical protein